MPRYRSDSLIVAIGARIGQISAGNYLEIESNGFIHYHGSAKPWVDEFGSLIGSRLESPSSDIVQNVAEGSYTFKSTARYPTDYLQLNIQINHYWILLGLVDYHIHFWQTNAAMPNWLLSYRWQVNGAAKETAWTNKAWQDNVFSYVSGTLVQITDFESLTLPGSTGVSPILQLRLARDYTNVSTLFGGAETSGINVDALFADSHIQKDTDGSRLEYTK